MSNSGLAPMWAPPIGKMLSKLSGQSRSIITLRVLPAPPKGYFKFSLPSFSLNILNLRACLPYFWLLKPDNLPFFVQSSKSFFLRVNNLLLLSCTALGCCYFCTVRCEWTDRFGCIIYEKKLKIIESHAFEDDKNLEVTKWQRMGVPPDHRFLIGSPQPLTRPKPLANARKFTYASWSLCTVHWLRRQLLVLKIWAPIPVGRLQRLPDPQSRWNRGSSRPGNSNRRGWSGTATYKQIFYS